MMLAIIFLCVLSQQVRGQNENCTQNCQQMAYYDCNICYESCKIGMELSSNDTGEYQFSMKKCTYTFCQYWIKVNVNCQSYRTLDLTQHDCIKQCCNNPGYDTFTQQIFNQCVTVNQNLQQNQSTTETIVLSVLGGIVLIGFVIYLISRCDVLSKVKQSCHQCQIRLNQIDIKKQKLNWTEAQNRLTQSINDEYCSICLQGNMNCITSCGHKFHFSCFKQWTFKNPSCPNCKSQQFNDLKIYCQKCTKKQATYCLKINQNGKIKLFQQPKIICNECNKMKNKIKKIFLDEDRTSKQIKLELIRL